MGKLIRRTTTTVEEEFIDDGCGAKLGDAALAERTEELATTGSDGEQDADEVESDDADGVEAAQPRECACPPLRAGARAR